MAYTRATLVEFQAIFPGFDAVTQPQYDFWVAEAERVVTSAWGDDQQRSTMLCTAHYLASNGYGTSGEAQIAGFGGATDIRSGTLSLGFSKDSKASSNTWLSTRYGKDLWPLIRLYSGAPLVTASGTLPYGCGRFPHGES